MSILTKFKGRRAYQAHIMGNQAIDKGEIERAKEQHNKALQLYEEAYNEGCRESNILMAWSVLLMRFGNYERAKDLLLSCEHARDLDNKSKKQLRIDYSICQWRLGNLDKAIELMESAASSGKTSLIYTTLGFYYIEKARETGDYTKAEEFNSEAMQYDEEDAGILDNMGQLYYIKGETETAYEYFSKAYNQKPTQVSTLYYIALINKERGNKEKALAFIERCVEGNFSALCQFSRDDALALKKQIEEMP